MAASPSVLELRAFLVRESLIDAHEAIKLLNCLLGIKQSMLNKLPEHPRCAMGLEAHRLRFASQTPVPRQDDALAITRVEYYRAVSNREPRALNMNRSDGEELLG
jgi:hypothetical protein